MDERRLRWWLALIAALSAILVYLNGLANPFVYDDLTRWAMPAPHVRDLLAPRPLTELTHFIDRALFGTWPPGHHGTSLLLHVVSVLLTFHLAAALAPEAQRLRVALVAALLFAVHPVQTEAVGYVSARSDLLCTAACLGATLAWLRWRTTGRAGGAVAAIALYLLALASKETAAALPLVWTIANVGARRRLWTFNLPLLLVTGAAGAARIAINVRLESGHLPGLQHLLTQATVQWRYFSLLLWPRGQTLFHGLPRVDAAQPLAWLALGAWLTLAAIAVIAARRKPAAGMALVWLLAFLLPAAVLPLKDAMAEHRLHTASVGAMILVALGLARVPLRPATVLTALIACALAAATLVRNRLWSSPVELWREAARAAPWAWAPRYALGDALRESGDCGSALAAYREAARLEPREARPRINGALCLAQLGRLDEAELDLQAALSLAPRDPAVHNDLGMLALARGRPDEARAHFERALSFDSQHARARANLARIPVK